MVDMSKDAKIPQYFGKTSTFHIPMVFDHIPSKYVVDNFLDFENSRFKPISKYRVRFTLKNGSRFVYVL